MATKVYMKHQNDPLRSLVTALAPSVSFSAASTGSAEQKVETLLQMTKTSTRIFSLMFTYLSNLAATVQ